MKRTALVSGVATALLVTAAACSSGGSGSSGSSGSNTTTAPPATSAPPASSAPANASTITIAGFAFTGPLTVAPGATVTVINSDSANHTVTADTAGQFDVKAPAGQTVTFTAPATAGTYPFHCSIHPEMHGKLIVK